MLDFMDKLMNYIYYFRGYFINHVKAIQMRIVLLNLFLYFLAFTINSQVFEGIIKYEQFADRKSDEKKDMLLASPIFDENLTFNSEYEPYTATCFVKKDSVFIEKYLLGLPDPDFYIYQAGDTALLLDNSTGHIHDYHWYGRKFTPEFKQKKKIKIILGYECTLYRAQNEKLKIDLWVTDKLKIDKNLEAFNKYHYNGSFILEQEYFFKSTGTKLHTITTEIKPNVPTNIYPKLEAFKKEDFSKKLYAPISQNDSLSSNSVEVGDTLANLFYRSVETFKERPIYAFKNNGKFLLVEFWGTWCAPCLSASPKIKAFYDKNRNKVDVLSFNAADKRYDRIKRVIEKKEMNWEQGLATKKIISVLNKQGFYPTMVLLNDQMEVLFIGNPGVDFPKVENIINSK